MTSARRVLALVALLVLAGCAAPTQPAAPTTPAPTTPADATTTRTTTTASPTTTEASGGDAAAAIDVRNGTLPVNATRIFTRVRTLTGANASPPAVVRVVGNSEMQVAARGLPPFARLMGIRAPEASGEVTAAGVTRGADYVALNVRALQRARSTEAILAHEFAHVVQFDANAMERTRDALRVGTTDERLTYLAVVEGTAVYVESRYQARYGNQTPGRVRMARAYRNASGVRKYALAPYRFGARYAATRFANASAVDAIYDDPPTSTEAVVHGERANLTRPRLSVDVDTRSWTWSDRDRMGELFVRHALATELASDRAARAAAGWGMDRRLTFRRGGDVGYAWALRWDTPRDADEFERALRDYLDARATRSGGAWRDGDAAFAVTRVGEETVVLTAGDPGFVENATVTGADATVTVRAS